ncbi:MAG: aminoacyl-tRNA hydrolase [Saprospiraceae bacterium]|nr:aminoacyl-tRNA hydrolase [Saprospiraceae bacterium]
MFGFLQRLFKRQTEEPDPMKYLVTGIGNMGAEYDGTRHNIGFDVIDALAAKHEVTYKQEHLGDVGEFRFKGRTFVLLKPSTYVNRSGKAVRYWLQKKKVNKRNLLVIVDDMNLEFGQFRLRGKGSDGGHNGLKDINDMIGSDYARLRIGIGNAPKGQHVNFVLGPWSDQERADLPQMTDRACEVVYDFASRGLQEAMNLHNG